MRGSERINRTSPELSPESFWGWVFLLVALPHLTFRVALVSRAGLGVSPRQTFLLVFPIVIRVRIYCFG